jgi:hypothetical protein
MQYPKWFPRPKSWLWALIISLSVFPMYFIAKGFLTLGLISSGISEKTLWGYIAIIIGFIIIPIWLLAIIYQFLWSEPHPKLSKWIPRLKNLGEGGYAWLMLIIYLTVMGLFLSVGSDRHPVYQLRKLGYFNPKALILILTVLTAYGYHLKSLIGAKFQAKRTP